MKPEGRTESLMLNVARQERARFSEWSGDIAAQKQQNLEVAIISKPS